MKKSNLYICLLLVFVLTGCATLFGKKNHIVTITSEPANAKVYINGSYRGMSPLTISLEPDSDINVMVKKKGYQEGTAIIQKGIQGVAFLNLLSPICWIVDFASGSIYKFKQNEIAVQLLKKGAAFNSSFIEAGDKMVKLTKGKRMYIYAPENKK